MNSSPSTARMRPRPRNRPIIEVSLPAASLVDLSSLCRSAVPAPLAEWTETRAHRTAGGGPCVTRHTGPPTPPESAGGNDLDAAGSLVGHLGRHAAEESGDPATLPSTDDENIRPLSPRRFDDRFSRIPVPDERGRPDAG